MRSTIRALVAQRRERLRRSDGRGGFVLPLDDAALEAMAERRQREARSAARRRLASWRQKRPSSTEAQRAEIRLLQEQSDYWASLSPAAKSPRRLARALGSSWADEMEADPTLAGCEIEEAEAWSVVDGDEDDVGVEPGGADALDELESKLCAQIEEELGLEVRREVTYADAVDRAKQLRDKGRVARGWLGIMGRDVRPALGGAEPTSGAAVASAAAHGGSPSRVAHSRSRSPRRLCRMA